MPSIEYDPESQTPTNVAFDRFDAIVRMGKQIIDLETEADKVRENIVLLNIPPHPGREGKVTLLSKFVEIDVEGNTDVDNLVIQEYIPNLDMRWVRVQPKSKRYESLTLRMARKQEEKRYFIGNNVEVDPDDGHVWVYGQEGLVRAQHDVTTVLDEEDLTVIEEIDNKRQQQTGSGSTGQFSEHTVSPVPATEDRWL